MHTWILSDYVVMASEISIFLLNDGFTWLSAERPVFFLLELLTLRLNHKAMYQIDVQEVALSIDICCPSDFVTHLSN